MAEIIIDTALRILAGYMLVVGYLWTTTTATGSVERAIHTATNRLAGTAMIGFAAILLALL
jgi:hypothetical protein